MEKDKISIIVPVYNVELYLAECLDSIINQSHQNLEIILVNDGSTDQSAKICDFYVAKDHRITVIHKENEGLSSARNEGMKRINGNYVSFVDSDDKIDLRFCENLLKWMDTYEADIVECGFKPFSDETEIQTSEISNSNDSITEYSTREALYAMIDNRLELVVWNKLYKTETIAGIRFENRKINEDVFWSYQIFANAKKIVKTNQPLYFYRQHPDSIMGKAYSIKRLDGIDALERRLEFMNQNFPELNSIASLSFFKGSFYAYQKITLDQELDKTGEHRAALYQKMRKLKDKNYIRSWNFRARMWYHFFIMTPDFCVKFRNKIGVGI